MGQRPEILKDLEYKLHNPKKTIRGPYLLELKQQAGSLSPQDSKLLYRALAKTLFWSGGGTRRAIRGLVRVLVTNQPPEHSELLLRALGEATLFLRAMPCPHHLGPAALEALTWSTLLALHPSPSKNLVPLQALLLTSIAASSDPHLLATANTRLHNSLKSKPDLLELYVKTLSGMEPSGETLVLWSYLMDLVKKQGLLEKCRATLLDHFTKVNLQGKPGLPPHILSALKPLLRIFSHEDFRSSLLPLINKSLLRNPELVLETLGYILEGVSLDLSQYALELGEALRNHIISKDEKCQSEAILCFKNLAVQCSNGESVQELLQLLFDVLNGKYGKLTITNQRMGVLLAIGNLSYNIVVGSSTVMKLSEFVCQNLISLLKQEIHEGILITTLKQFSLWCSKFSTGLPTFIVDWFKVGVTLKSSTLDVRCCYLQCLFNSLKNQESSSLQNLMPYLTKASESAFGTAVNVRMISESLLAICCLIKLEITSDAMIKKICDVGKNLVLSEKFLTNANEDSLKYVVVLAEKLLLDHAESLNPSSQPLYQALVMLLLHSKHEVRRQARALCTKITNVFPTEHFSLPVLQELLSTLTQDSEASGKYVTPALLALCSPKISNDYKLAFTRKAFLVAHHPLNGSWQACHALWCKVLKELNVDKSILMQSPREIQSLLTSYEGKMDSSKVNALATLIHDFPTIYIPQFMKYVITNLDDHAFMEVTNRDYNIFMTPDGEVYDGSVYESYKEDDQYKNMKRESKLYSYKEQLAEIELKKELEAKRKAENPNKKPELTKKQQELKALQMEKESQIRSKVKSLESRLLKFLSLLEALVNPPHPTEGAKNNTKWEYLPQILKSLIGLLASPLCAAPAAAILVQLGDVVMASPILGRQITHLTLHVLKPACNLSSAWVFPDPEASAMALLKKLGPHTSSLTLAFPLAKWLLLKSGASDDQKLKCLEILSEHTLRSKFELNTTDPLISPKLLPISELIAVLLRVVESDTSFRHLAQKVLLQVDNLGFTYEDCNLLTYSEIKMYLEALKSDTSAVRNIALQSLQLLSNIVASYYEEHEEEIVKRYWIAKFDVDPENIKHAAPLYENSRLTFEERYCVSLLQDIKNPLESLREATSSALAEALKQHPSQVHPIVLHLVMIYRDYKWVAPVILDSFNRVIAEPPPDHWEPRSGVALALLKIAHLLNEEIIKELMTFYLTDSLSDPHNIVRKDMLNSAVKIVDIHGKQTINVLLPMFEDFLSETPETSTYDDVRQGVVILMGTLAQHLEEQDPKIKPIIAKLIQTLSTPSQQVQEAVANCLIPLVPAIKDEAPDHINRLLKLLLESSKYGEKRGAAYGLAGMVKGLGIFSLKQHNIIDILVKAIENKKDPKQREGALLALEMLCNILGRLFEPYIVHVLPNLLICFGDHDKDVRRATDDTAKAVMSKLSAHGVKLVLPSLLEALKEESWRTKASSVELLGAMAFCAPKQLSSCLPNIVPKLIEVLSDSHNKVQKAGAQALKLIGSVIRNPEIQAIVPVLLEALQDPAKKTSACLTNLLNTKFVHVIDAPSLALIMPVVHRAFLDRSTETRKMAAQIIGNMYSLTDQKDLAPYLPTILPGLKQSLLDPVPEVRSVSARALGTMARGMGDSTFEDLIPWLMKTLTSEVSSVDRSGAAQGLSEVLGGLGLEKLYTLMPEIINRAERTDIQPHIKDGYIMMFIYLPMVFNKEFTPFIGPITKPILKALADENEFVRETALKAGQRVVNQYAETSIELLLPELERGLFDDNWRIRYSSIQLLGDLLYKISGVSGKMSTESADDDDNFGTEQSQKAILRALGTDRQQRVLAGLYMGRSDVGLMVRQAALHVWKVVVSNTPRTLREILPTLFSLLLGCLASNSHDKRQIAAKTLGDLVRKLGERVLPEIIPILEKGLDSKEPDQRQGVCIGLSEIMSSTSKEMVLTFFDSLVPTVRRALSDELPEVRKAAAKTFDSLHSNVGGRALDEILPPLLEQLNDPEKSENTLDGLKQVMAIKSKVVLPYLVPQLTSPPVNTKALALLSTVAGDALTKHLNKLLPALLTALGTALNSSMETSELEYCQAVVMSVTGEQGVRTIVDFLLEASRHENLSEKKAAVALLSAFCSQSKAEISSYIPQLLRGLIHLYTYDDKDILQNSLEALTAITKTLDSTSQLQLVSDIRQTVRFAASDLRGKKLLPGFCQTKGIMPILPIFREAILNGTPEAKEQASQGLGEVIKLTSSEALKPCVVNITGPLIRILGDRFTWNVKVAVLDTLAQLLHKVGPQLKPFLPQLQATFLKSLQDPNRSVRLKAASAFSHLISIHSKSETLFIELHLAIKASEDAQIKETSIYALRCVIKEAGDKLGEATRSSILSTLMSLLTLPDDSLRQVTASCLGSMCCCLSQGELQTMANYILDEDPATEWLLRHGKSITLMVVLKEVPERLMVPELQEKVNRCLLSYMSADRLPIALMGIRAAAYLFTHLISTEQPLPPNLLQTYSKCMNHSCNEVKQVMAQGINFLARACPHRPLPTPLLKAVVPQLVNGTKEKNTMVRANSEMALVSLLDLRTTGGEAPCLAILEPGARDALSDVIQKALRKAASLPQPKEDDFDCTLLT